MSLIHYCTIVSNLKMMKLSACILICFLLVCYGDLLDAFQCNGNIEKCMSLADDDILNIHLVPHSHDDVGWLKTVDQYYYGIHSETQNAGVRSILSSVVQALKNNPERKFIQVETAFFWKWWNEQPNETRTDFKNFVNNGQIEMVNGGWSMNDEGATNYQSIVDQFTWGLRKIDETVGECGLPKVGWQIDPFGHSREHASLLNQMGFHGLFIGRLDYRDKDERIKNRELDFMWHSSSSRNDSQIFTSIFPDFYVAPICFDILCGTAIIDDEDSPEYNVDTMTETIYNLTNKYSTYYRTKNVLVPMGGDFHFQGAETNYINIDRLIKYFNDRYNETRLLYSTPSCYIAAVTQAGINNKTNFPDYTEDFFPHASDPDAMWTGYFSSRPNSKRNERLGNNILQAAKQLTSIGKIEGVIDRDDHLNKFREAMGIMQHHDAITGTEKFAVSQDYTRLLSASIKNSEEVLFDIIRKLIGKSSNASELAYTTCHLANVSICSVTDEDTFLVTVYNPLSQSISPYIRIPVTETNYTISTLNGSVEFDIVSPISNFSYVQLEKNAPKPNELVFRAKDTPALGIKTFYIQITSEDNAAPIPDYCTNMTFGTEILGFSINKTTGLLNKVKYDSREYSVSQSFLYYNSAVGNNNVSDEHWENRASGAYIFRPNGTANEIISNITYSCYRGKNVDEVKQVINDWITQVIRVYKDGETSHIEFDWLVGPIPVSTDDKVGKEIISRFTIDGITTTNFYTDSNGREMMKRTLDYRPYPYNASIEPVAGSYYPVTSKITIKDKNANIQISVLNDRAQGGSSLNSGEIELMVHRRILHDDAFGVDEALDEKEFGEGVVARGKHYLLIGPVELEMKESSILTSYKEGTLEKQVLLEPWIALASTNKSLEEIKNDIQLQYSVLSTNIPKNMHILTFEPWKNNQFLLRLEHFFAILEDPDLSKDINFALDELLFQSSRTSKKYQLTDVQEMTLGANEKIGNKANQNSKKNGLKTAKNIILKPMEIKTFLVKIDEVKKENNAAVSTFVSTKLLTFFVLFIISILNR